MPAHPQTVALRTSLSDIRLRDSGGSGPAVVFLCDPPVTVEAYDELIATLSDDFRVLVAELPGFGFSRTHASAATNFQESVEAVETALQSLNLDSCVVCGPCIAGFVAAELVRRDHLPIRGLVLLQTPDLAGMRSWRVRMDPKRLLRMPFIGQLIVRLSASRISRFWVKFATGKIYDHRRLEEYCIGALKAGGSYPLATMLQLWGDGPSDDPLTVPAIAIWGKQDRSHRSTSSQCTKQHVPDAAIIEFESCGHFTELEDPEGFAAAIRSFLGSNLGAAIE